MLEPLQVERQDLSDAHGSKVHIRLIVPADAARDRIDELVRRAAADEWQRSGAEREQPDSLWISGFLDGMDINSVAFAFGTARWWAIGGALLFYVSDAFIGWSRFVKHFPGERLAIMTTYHLGQVGIVLSLLGTA